MLKQHYRTEMGMISDILQVTMDRGRQGAKISSIARAANLSHYTAIEKCHKLIDFALIQYTTEKKSRIYIITEKGIQFFSEMQKFIEIVRAVKIRY